MLKFLSKFFKKSDVLTNEDREGLLAQKAQAAQAAQKAQAVAQEAQVARGGGERQASPDISKVRADHRKRYDFAAKYIAAGDQVLDLACGVGYGSYILSNQTGCDSILAIDLSQDAIDYANKYYLTPKIQYVQGDCLKVSIPPSRFNVCVSFETVEHIPNDSQLLKRFYEALKPGGKLILSTPNQAELPFDKDKFPFHCKHYLPDELERLINDAGFLIDEVASQKNKRTGDITPGWDGLFNIVVCHKQN